jgi:hypothetical protein
MKTIPVLNQAPRHEDVWGIRGVSPRVLNLYARWLWVRLSVTSVLILSCHESRISRVVPYLDVFELIWRMYLLFPHAYYMSRQSGEDHVVIFVYGIFVLILC